MKFQGLLASRDGGYLSFGLRHGAFTPYATVAQTSLTGQQALQLLDVENVPPESAETAAALNAQLAAIVANVPDQRSFSLGLRCQRRDEGAVGLGVERDRGDARRTKAEKPHDRRGEGRRSERFFQTTTRGES